ncbi:MAG: hypothetical protein Q8M11_17900 [Sulfuritalea sp.]|nr:hypothetical protein [Sulfuritalea sp.]
MRLDTIGAGGPAQAAVQGAGDVGKLRRGVVLVPAQHAQHGQVAVLGFVGEMRQGDLAVARRAETGNEQQVARMPGLVATAFLGVGAALDRQAVEHPAQDDDGQALALELDEEDAPGLAAAQRPQLLDAADGDTVLVVQEQFVGVPVEEGVVDILDVHRPVQFGVEIAHQLCRVGNGAQFFDLRVLCDCSGGHRVFPQFSSTPSTRRAGAPRRPAPGPA